MNKVVWNSETIKAIATIVITAIVNVANVLGYQMDAEPLVKLALSIVSAAALVYSWWKNQNVTAAAQHAQTVLDELKSQAEPLPETPEGE